MQDMRRNVRNIDMHEDIMSFACRDAAQPFFVSLCGVSYCNGSYRINRPHSNISVIEYIVSGCGTVHENRETVFPAEGDVYYLKQGRDHLYYSDVAHPWTKLWFNFSGALAEQITHCYHLDQTMLFHAPDTKFLFCRALEIARSGIPAAQVSAQIAVVFLEIVQRLSAGQVAAVTAEQAAAEKIKAQIDQTTNLRCTLDELILPTSYSKSHAIRLFRAVYGVTPYEYLLRRRFEMAASLLRNTALSVTDIAEKTGFCDVHYFSGCFSRRFGASPAAYRKNQPHA